ncbi:MAG: hypothetical protein IJ218_02415 [Alphaproteobacteria bacterium]|nr:hypothetical protein [Alphaproteobacteria bacterium]
MTNYTNWKILKIDADEKADEYAEVAEWCNQNGQYTIEDDGEYYKVVALPEPTPPTDEKIRQMRAAAYAAEVDGTTAHIQRLRDTNPMTAEIEAQIAVLIAERDAKVAEIKERYPYNDGGK